MRTRVNQSTFDKIINNDIFLDKTYAKNDQVVPGYQYEVKEFNFIDWLETGRRAKLRVEEILSPISSGDFNTYRVNSRYRFFKFQVVEINHG